MARREAARFQPAQCSAAVTHDDADGTRVDATLALGRRHPLDAVNAGFPPQVPERAVASHFEQSLLVRSRDSSRRAPRTDSLDRDRLDDAGFPAFPLRDALVHPDKFGRKQGGLVPSDAGLELDERRKRRDGRRRRECFEEGGAERAQSVFGDGEIRLGEFPHVFVRFRFGEVSQGQDEL